MKSSGTLRNRIKELKSAEGGIEVLSVNSVGALADEFKLTYKSVELSALESCVLPLRYLRNLGTVGWDGQATLLRSSVAVIGLGGLGGYVVEGLARMGIGSLVLVDGDIFADHNLNRQIFSSESMLAHSKADSASARVAEINSATEVTIHHNWLTPDNASDIIVGADVVVDCLDALDTRLFLQSCAQSLGLPLVHGAIAGYTGQVMSIFPGDIGLRAFYSTEKAPRHGVEQRYGNPAATPMMVAAWQIQEVVKILLKTGKPLRNRMLLMDAEMGRVQLVSISSS